MKYQFNDEEKILVCLANQNPINDMKVDVQFNSIALYKICDLRDVDKISNYGEIVSYLDRFIILLPKDYASQRTLWCDFYHYFGNIYEKIVDMDCNIKCIKMMIEYLDSVHPEKEDYRILDYGCGSGLSLCIETKKEIIGYEPIEEMRVQAKSKGMKVFHKGNIECIPNGYFDAVFASYVFHMAIDESDILRVIPKLKNGAIWVANFYKNINETYVNEIFSKEGFTVRRIENTEQGLGHVYEYRRKER